MLPHPSPASHPQTSAQPAAHWLWHRAIVLKVDGCRSPSTVSDARALESTEQQQQQRGRLGGAVVSLHAASGSEEQRAEEKREREELGGELGARGGLEYLVYQDPSLSRLEPWNVSINTSTMVTPAGCRL